MNLFKNLFGKSKDTAMTKSLVEIPLDVQLQAVCIPKEWDSYHLFVSFIPNLQKLPRERWMSFGDHLTKYQIEVKKYLTFTADDLLSYLKFHPDTCQALLSDSEDKRYPSTFLAEMKGGKYRVGRVTHNGDPLIIEIRVFSSLWEAATDYVLFSWGFPRLSKKLSLWYEMDHY